MARLISGATAALKYHGAVCHDRRMYINGAWREGSDGGVAETVADAFVERFAVEPQADGPLRGTSFAVKDIFDVAGRFTGGGNPAWRANHAAATADASPAAPPAAPHRRWRPARSTSPWRATRQDRCACPPPGAVSTECAPPTAASPLAD